jgi:hypothetical protein
VAQSRRQANIIAKKGESTMAKPKPKPQPKYSWIQSGNYVYCFKGWGGQDVAKLWEAEELTEFHNAELARATKEINAILSKVENNNRHPERKLSLIEFQNRHLLVWARYGVVGQEDDDKTIRKALKLKGR